MGKISNSSQRKAGVILQYGQMMLSILIQLVYTPIMLRILGSNEYGIYNTATSIISYLSLLSLGMGSSYIRWYSIYKNDDDNEKIKKLNGLYLLVFCFIGVIAVMIGAILTVNVHHLYNDTYSVDEIHIARVLMGFLTVNLAVSFPASVFTSYITSQEKFVFQKLINMITTVIAPTINIVLLYCGFGSIGMVITTTTISIITMIINAIYCLNKLNMQITFRNPDWLLLKDIFAFSIFIAINQIIDQINWQTDKIILGKFVNGTAVAVYAVGAQINMMYTNMSAAISGVFAPKVNRIVSKQDENMDKELTQLFIKVGRIQWYLLFLILSGFVFFGRYFVYRWAGEDYYNTYYVALLLMAPAIVPLIQNIGIEIQRAKYKHKFRSIVYLFMALFNIGISIVLAQLWHEIGAAIGTTISLVVANGFIMNIYCHKCCGINIISFWKSITSTIKGLLIPLAFGIVLMIFYNFHSLLDFGGLILAYVIVYSISVYILSMNIEEKELVRSMIKKVLCR